MKFGLFVTSIGLAPAVIAASLAAQAGPSIGEQQADLREAKNRAAEAQQRAEFLRQEASDATSTADRLTAQRAMLASEIEAAEAQIEAAKARLAIIADRQKEQRSRLGIASEPMLRLNAALQAMTGRPASLLIAQPGTRADYVHLRAVLATVQVDIGHKTAALRAQIAAQNELRDQEVLALKTLNDARAKLNERRLALVGLEKEARVKAGGLSADAAYEFEQAIAQGERARDLVANIDTQRSGTETANALSALDGPLLRPGTGNAPRANNSAYILPGRGNLVFGFNELSETGYRQRGVRLSLAPSASVGAPAAGKISYAGHYRSYGQIVIIEHGGGWTTLITNLADLSVSDGETVRQGQKLGTVSDDNPQISLELRRHGRTMDVAALFL